MATESKSRRATFGLACAALVAVLAGLALHRPAITRGARQRSASSAPAHAAPAAGAHVARRQPASAQAADDSTIRAAVGRIVGALAAELTEGLALHPSKSAYDACVRAQGSCESMFADMISLSIASSRAKVRARSDELDLAQWSAGDGGRVVHEAIAQIVSASADPIERIAALILLKYGVMPAEHRNRPLPDAAYSDLAGRPIPEARLLGDRHLAQAPSASAAAEFVRLVRSPDVRARRAGFDALGHPALAARLHEAVLAVGSKHTDWEHLAMAIGRCGLACAATAEHVLMLGRRDARIALYEAIGLAPNGEREQLVQVVLDRTPAELHEQERAQRTSMLDDALGKQSSH